MLVGELSELLSPVLVAQVSVLPKLVELGVQV